MTHLSSSAIAKIHKLIPRLASDHDGEVVATARAIIRSLKSSGADLHDLATAIDKPPVERIVYREKIIYRDHPKAAPEPELRPEPEYSSTYSFKEVRATADRLLDADQCEMNAAEKKFIQNMRDSAHKWKGKFRMTVRQAEWFRQIVDEYLGMEISA